MSDARVSIVGRMRVSLAVRERGAAAAGNYAAGFVAIGEHIYTRAVHDPEALNAIAAFWGMPPR